MPESYFHEVGIHLWFHAAVSFLIDILNEASHSSKRASSLWFALCHVVEVGMGVGCGLDGKVGGRGMHWPLNSRYFLIVIEVAVLLFSVSYDF